MTEEFKDMVGAALDAAAKAMRPGDSPLPVHVIEAVVGCTIQECSLHLGKLADAFLQDWRESNKVNTYLEGLADGFDDAAWELLKVSGVVRVVDTDD